MLPTPYYDRPTHLDLFSGIGGFALAAAWAGFKTIGFSEIDEYAVQVLKKNFPKIPNYGDVRNVPTIRCDLITGGFPCQPFSYAGKRRGSEDDRYLWPAMLDVIARCKPSWVLGENVPGISDLALDEVLTGLEDAGYSTQSLEIPACAVDAPHIRSRIWILAHRSEIRANEGLESLQKAEISRQSGGVSWGDWVSWLDSSYFAGAHDGLSNWVGANQSLGNAIVPQVAFQILKAMRSTTADIC